MLKFNEKWLDYWIEKMLDDIDGVYAIGTDNVIYPGDLVKEVEDRVAKTTGMWHRDETPKDTGLTEMVFTSKALNGDRMCTHEQPEPVYFVREEGIYSRTKFSIREGEDNGDL